MISIALMIGVCDTMGKERKGEDLNYSSKKPITTITVSVETGKIHNKMDHYREKKKINVTFGDVILHAISIRLKDYMEFNSNFVKGVEIYPKIDVGYLVNLGNGTYNLIIRDADKKDIAELSAEIKENVLKYMRKEELADNGTSTIIVTNLSPFGGYLIMPPLYEKQTSTIAICSEFDSLKCVKGEIKPAKKFNITLSFDSRVIDCQKALGFLNSIKDMLEGG